VSLVDVVDARNGDEAASRAPRYWSRRAFDLVLGVPLSLLAVPVVLLAALVLAVRFRANPFFIHNRVGYGGRTITIPKLRTLSPDTHPYADKTVVRIEAPHGFTRFLRKSHLDELPQLLLVLGGRLSLVGPRPRMLSEIDDHGDDDYDDRRTSVPQGCTGLWQVSAGQGARVSDHPEYDEFYVDQHTMLLDVWILWRTFRQIFGHAPVSFEDIPLWALRDPDCARTPAAS
jgi:lipopolysaccharide/colanic/teichoic acid biosynthesis glycosyltransferase